MKADIVERVAVSSIEAEQSVLGALLLYPSEAEKLVLTAAEFHHTSHRTIFARSPTT